MQSELEANKRNRRQARENACDQVTIGFSLESDWLRKWRKFFKPIRESVLKQNQSKRILLSTQYLKPL